MDTQETVVLTGKNGELSFDPQMISALQSKFRTRDVRGELLKARLWLLRYLKIKHGSGSPLRVLAMVE